MNKCDLEEISHALCQEALLIPADGWVRNDDISIFGMCYYESRNGKFSIEEYTSPTTKAISLCAGYRDKLCQSFRPDFRLLKDCTPETKEDIVAYLKTQEIEYEKSPATIILKAIRSREKEIEEEEKCKRLLSALHGS